MEQVRLASSGSREMRLLVVPILVLLLTLEASPAAGASSKACQVRNDKTGQTYRRLQQAVDAAKPGARLVVRGTCHGKTVVDKGLLIEGVRSPQPGDPILDGDEEGVVLTVRSGVTVTITTLTVQGGRGRLRTGGATTPWLRPAGIENQGRLSLRDVTVRRNIGLGVLNTGRLRLTGASVIGRNGVERMNEHVGVLNKGRLQLHGSATIRQNNWGVKNRGTLVLNGASTIKSNTLGVENSGSLTLNDRGGLFDFGWGIENSGSVTLNDDSWIIGHYRLASRGILGIDNLDAGVVTLNHRSRISDNGTAMSNAGTVILNDTSHISGNHQGVDNTGTLTLNGSASIRANHLAEVCYGSGLYCVRDPVGGGGVRNSGTLVLNDLSTISGNTVAAWHHGSYGGGVYLVDDTRPGHPSLTMTGSSSITGNAADDIGGGIFVSADSLLVGVGCAPQTYANVYGNTPDDCYIEG